MTSLVATRGYAYVDGRKRCLMIGAGGMAGNWLRRFFAPFGDRMVVAGVVDVDPKILESARADLGLTASQCFTDMAKAFAEVEADFCGIAIPPAYHRDAVLHAVRRGLPILSEKPIADTWESTLTIYRAVTAAGLKMQVIQNYRYEAPMLTMRQVLRDGELGQTNYIVGRFAADYREYLSWGKAFRHEIPHALLVEGAVHHFDMLRNLSGSDCVKLAGWEWNPPWSSSKGEFNNLYQARMANGIHASYEGSGTAAGEQNTWHEEYYRAECERGAISVGRDRVVRIHRFRKGGGLVTEEVPAPKPRYEGHVWLVDEFLTWLDGGPAPDTVLADNIKTAAMLFAAIEASRTESVVDVEAMVREATG